MQVLSKCNFKYFVLASLLIMVGCSSGSHENRDILFQISTINYLLDGRYDGELTYEKLKEVGDFGIGTFHQLDGEMIGLDGKFYQIKADGVAYPVDYSTTTPFAVVTFFDADKTLTLNDSVNFEQLKAYLDGSMPAKSIFYAIRMDGSFKYVKTRSVPKQEKPYRRLVDVVSEQPVFEFNDVKGTIVGFWCPDYVEGVNVPGYHFHFITEDRKAGGHLLDCQIESVKVAIDNTSEFYMVSPYIIEDTASASDTSENRQKELEKVEKQH